MGVPRTYHATVLVLKKTKLKEADLIMTLLLGDGSLAQAVAKGARKPTSTFATRLDLFCESEVMLARGRNLDIASETRLLNSHDALKSNAVAVFAASPILDLLAQTALPNLPVANLFPMASSALSHMDDAPEQVLPSLTGAFSLKLLALLGVRPQLDRCVVCGSSIEEECDAEAFFSFDDGGYVCGRCSSAFERVRLDRDTLKWAHLLLRSTFDEVVAERVPTDASFAVLHVVNQWLRETQSVNSKALAQLLSCGLF
ncbi:MAG: DNA repair protein RecO [Eggerthellaceae bacterium]|nr:DNA repair protein RecO [Eggerthellaceae bacterium]